MADYQSETRQIPWTALRTAHGTAAHVPEALIGLMSADKEARERAYWKLDNYVVLQGSLYESALYLIPILLMMLEDRVRHGRERIYDLLVEIAAGHAPENVTVTARDGQALPLREACRSAVDRGRHIFIRDQGDSNPIIRTQATDLLECFDE